ncbi:MAG: DUF4347 domain-containing protein [Leptolyngbyaceae cyanobacterium]
MSASSNTSTFDGSQGIIFVDSGISDYQDLISGFQPGSQVHILNSEEDGIDQISQVLTQYSNLDSVHIFSHGDVGSLQLGDTTLSQGTIGNYTAALQDWSSSLAEDADVLFYGCNLAGTPDGLTMVDQMATLTGADVAASDDLTGNAAQGADWDLEVATGAIEATTLTSAVFQGTLATFSFTGGALTVEDADGDDNIFDFSLVNGDSLQVADNSTVLGTALIADITSIDLIAGAGDDTVTFSSGFNLFGDAADIFVDLGLGSDQFDIDAVVETEGGIFKVNETIADASLAFETDNAPPGEFFDFTNLEYDDTINFNDNVSTVATDGTGGAFTVTGEQINVADNVTLASGTSDIRLNAAHLSTTTLQNIAPVLFDGDELSAVAKTAEINIGSGSDISGNNVIIKAQAEDLTNLLIDALASDNPLNDLSPGLGNGAIGALIGVIDDLTTVPVKVLFKASEAFVNVGSAANIQGLAGVSIEASAISDSSGSAQNELFGTSISPFSIGYGDATANAGVDIGTNVTVNAGEAVVIGSNAEATAEIDSEVDDTPGDTFALAVGVSVTDATALTTVAEGATITAGKTANVVATGTSDNGVEAKSEDDDNGILGFGVGLGFADANIQTIFNGTITANQGEGSVVKIEFDPTVTADGDPDAMGFIDFANDTINVGPHALATGDKISYGSRRGNTIGFTEDLVDLDDPFSRDGLVDGADYYVIVDPNNPNLIQLARTELAALQGRAINLGDGQAGTIDIGGVITTGEDYGALNSKTFNPNGTYRDEANEPDIIDADEDTIILDNGVTLEPTTDLGNVSLLGSTFELGQAVRYKVGDGGTAIGGLEDGKVYYVIASTNENNLEGDQRFVDRQLIQLAETENEARAGIAIDIDLSGTTGTEHSFSAFHVIDSGLATGVGIIAELESNQSIASSVSIGDNDAIDDDADDDATNTAQGFFNKFASEYSNNASQSGTQAAALDAAGSFAFADVNNTVKATVGSTADVNSKEDLEVVGAITNELQLNASSEVDAENPKGGSSKALSAAVIVGLIDNDAQAVVESGAELDGYRATRVISDVTYPILTRFDEFVPTNLGELSDFIRGDDAPGSFEEFMKGTLDLESKLFNTWARSTSEANNYGVSGSVNYLDFDNTSKAVIESDAQINQDTTFLAATDPDFQDRVDEQVVSVEATNYMQLFNMTGVFDLDFADFSSLNPVGSQGTKGGLGGAFFMMLLDNTTHAIVESGAAIFSGADGGFNMKAEEAILNANLAQAGAKGENFALGGTFSYFEQTSDTLIQLADGVLVTGRNINLYGGGLSTHVNWAGGIARGESVGVGASVAINNITRDVNVVIGNLEDTTAGTDATTIDVTEDIDVLSKVDGVMWSFGLAGTALSGSDPVASGNNQFGIGISADIGLNTVTDTVNAYINDPGTGTIASDNLNVTAKNLSDLYAFSGAAAFVAASTSSSSTSAGLAGSYSQNTLNGTTRAYVKGKSDTGTQKLSLKTDGAMTVKAQRAGQIVAGSASGSIAQGANAAAIAGNVSINEITSTTEAFMVDVGEVINTDEFTATAAAVDVAAEDSSSIFAFGGALSAAFGNQTASIGAAIGQNDITSDVLAYLDGTVLESSGDVDVTATSARDIQSLTLSAAGAVAFNDSARFAIAGAAGITLNEIAGTTSADIRNDSNIVGAAALKVAATDASKIQADAGGFALSLTTGNVSGAVGASVAANTIGTTLAATIDDSIVDVSDTVEVSATSMADIDVLTMGGSFSGTAADDGFGFALSGAGAAAVNVIDNTILAAVQNGATVNADEDILVEAMDDSSIVADAGGVAVAASLATGGGGAAALSVGASFAGNAIGGTGHSVQALIDNATVASTNGNVDVTATSDAEIQTLSLAGSAALSGGTNVAIAVAAAGAFSQNTINTNTEASITNGSDVDAGDLVNLTATQTSTISGNAGAVAVGIGATFSLYSGGLAASLGGSYISNTIGNTVLTNIDNSSVTAANDVTQTTDVMSDIDALAIAGSFAASVSTLSVGLSGAGVFATNTINNTVEASITGGAIVDATTGDVILSAKDDSTILADAGAASIALAGGGAAGSLALGGAFANNTIGETNTVRAYINGSQVNAGDDIDLSADFSAEIDSFAIAGAFSVAIAGGGAIALSAVGVSSTNNISGTTEAYITQATSDITAGGSVNLTATDSAKINTEGTGATVSAAAAGFFAASGAAGIATATNTIGNTVRTYIGTVDASDSTKVVATGGVSLQTLSDAIITAQATAAAGAFSAAPFSAAISGAGADVDNTINKTISSFIGQGTTVEAGGAIAVEATDTSEIDVDVTALSASAAALGGSFGNSDATNTITNAVTASIKSGANVTSTAGTVDVLATSSATSVADAVATSVSLSLGFSESTTTANSTVNTDVEASVGNGAQVASGSSSDITVQADSSNSSTATTVSQSGGFVAEGVATAVSIATGDTDAFAGNGSSLTGGGLTIYADSQNDAIATATATAGGVASGTGASATATADPTTNASLGAGATAVVTGDVNILAKANAEADSNARGTSASVVYSAGVSQSFTNVAPTVSSSTGYYSFINAGGDVTIASDSGSVETGSAPAGNFEPLNNGVDDGTDAITLLANHNLDTGDTVVYEDQGNGPIGGLQETTTTFVGQDENGNDVSDTSLREYNVIRVDEDTIKLGVQFDASAIDASTDTISFAAPHNLQDGDQVVYSIVDGSTDIFENATTETVFLVRVIDDTTIKLVSSSGAFDADPLQTFSTTDVSGNAINLTNTFSPGDAVTYRAPAATEFNISVVDVTVTPDANSANVTLGVDPNANNIYLPDNDFEDGDIVTYTSSDPTDAIDGLDSGMTYEVNIDPNDVDGVITLLDSNGNEIALDVANNDSDTTHSLLNVEDEPIDGLEDGVTYYVFEANANSFTLAAAPDSTDEIPLDVSGLNSSKHQIGIEGIDLADLTAAGTYELRIDLDTSGLGGSTTQTHQILGEGGVSLAVLNPASGDGTSSSTASGSAGSLFSSSVVTTANLNGNYTVSTVSNAGITAGGDVAITSDSTSSLTGRGQNGAGGAIASGDALVNHNIDHSNSVIIPGAPEVIRSINADGDITIAANTADNVDVSVNADALGIGSSGNANVRSADGTEIETSTLTTIGSFTTINAGGDLSVLANTALDASSLAESDADGGGADSTANSELSGVLNTTVDLDSFEVSLKGNTVAIESSVSGLDVSSRGKATAEAAGVDAEASSDLDINSQVDTYLGNSGNFTISGIQGVDIQAQNQNISTNSTGRAELLAFVGLAESDADNDVILDATADAGDDLNVTAGPRVEGGPLESDDRVDNLGLFVEATNGMPSLSTSASSRVLAIPFVGDNDDNENLTDTANIVWDGDVGPEAFDGTSRELEIDANGDIVNAIGISVNGGQTNGIVTGDISVDDISGPTGDIVFKADDQVSTTTPDTASRPTFTYDFSNEDITITNLSDQNLILNNIFGAGDPNPEVIIDENNANSDNFKFNIETGDLTSPNAANIVVTNEGTSDVFLNGQIQNPIGSTAITNNGGSILADSPTHAIQSNSLDLDATGSIGTDDSTRINAQLVELNGTAIDVDADAGENLYLSLQGQSRDDSSGTPTDLTINLDGLTATNGDIDLELQDSVAQTTIEGTIGSVDVSLIQDGTENSTLSQEYFALFFPDTGSQPANLDVGVFGSGSTPIDTTYQLGTSTAAPGLSAGESITILAAETDTDLTNVIGFIDTDSDQDGTGSLTVNVDGEIDLTEVSGTVLLEDLTSTASDVTLTLPDTAVISSDTAIGEDLLMDNGTISAAGDVTLLVGDNFVASNNSTISAGGDVAIEVDSGNADAGDGGGIAINGSITVGDPLTGSIDVSGNTDDDILFFADTTTNVGITINGDAGADSIVSGDNDDTIFGGAGADEIGVGNGNNTVDAGSEDDFVYSLNNAISGTNQINLGSGDNEAWLQAGNNTITIEGNGNNTIGIGTGNDSVTVGDGDDFVYSVDGGGGTNTINLGGGTNTAWFQGGNNTITAGNGDNNIGVGTGNDTVTTGSGNDFVYSVDGGGGDDELNLGDGENTVFVRNGNYDITTGADNDEINLGSGTDTVDAGDGDNIIFQISPGGTIGNKTITTGSGNDFVELGNGTADIDLGTNIGESNGGFDVATGGNDGETYTLNQGNAGFLRVQDFVQGEDLLDISGAGLSFGDLRFETTNNDETRVIVDGTDVVLAVLNDFVLPLMEDDFIEV